MKKLLIATHNPGKITEFKELLEPKGIEILSAKDFDLPEPVEDGTTFEENALIKARTASDATGLPALSDDSGLCVNALKGDPGIYSARWAIKEDGSKDINYAMDLVNEKLDSNNNRTAYFIAVLAFALPNGTHQFFEGRCDGQIVWPKRGDHGHGYDPIFQPDGYQTTFAEMGETEKNKLSHRGKALQKFLKSLDS